MLYAPDDRRGVAGELFAWGWGQTLPTGIQTERPIGRPLRPTKRYAYFPLRLHGHSVSPLGVIFLWVQSMQSHE